MPKMQKTFLSLFSVRWMAQHSTLTIFNMFAPLPINPLLSLIISYRELRAKNVRQIATLIGYLTCKIVPGGSCLLGWCKFMIQPGPISWLAPPCDIRQGYIISSNLDSSKYPLAGVCTGPALLCSWLHVFQESIVWRWGEIARTVSDTSCPSPRCH